MSDASPPFDAARHMEAMAATMGLDMTEGQRPGVLQFLAVAHAMAAVVARAPLAAASFELAPVFRPGAMENDRDDA